ncbi:MAG: nucleoside diphosphate kinase regulator [Blastocatellales bacterium]
MRERTIYVTDFDEKRLERLLAGTRLWNRRDRKYLDKLEEELERASVVPSKEIPDDVLTMNSQARIKDLDSDKEMVFTLVFPADADYEGGKVSILAPIGTALLGYRAGDTIEWQVPGGVRRLKIEQILYQPEAAGDYHL